MSQEYPTDFLASAKDIKIQFFPVDRLRDWQVDSQPTGF